MKSELIISLLLIILPLGFLAFDYGREYLSADSCLDSSGSYHYEDGTCDRQDNHIFGSYGQRKKVIIVSCIVLPVFGMAMLIKTKRKDEIV